MAELETRQTAADLDAFIDAIDHDTRRADARLLLALVTEPRGD